MFSVAESREAAIGILGHVPPLPDGVTAVQACAFMDKLSAGEYQAGAKPWDHLGYTCSQQPGATGDQADFGVLALFRTYETGHPGELYNVMPAMFRSVRSV